MSQQEHEVHIRPALHASTQASQQRRQPRQPSRQRRQAWKPSAALTMHTRIVKPNQASVVHVQKAQLVRALASDEAHLPCVQNRNRHRVSSATLSVCWSQACLGKRSHFSSEPVLISVLISALLFSLPKRRRVARVTVLSLPRVGSTPPRWRWSCCRTPPHGV